MKYHHHQHQQLHSPNAGMQLMAASRCTSGTCCPGSGSGSGLRSLICDPNGIIIAEAVYRCMVCAELFEALEEMHLHYQVEHLATSELPTPSPSSTPSTYSRTSASFFGSPVATTVTDYEDDPRFEMSVAAERAISSASSYNDHYGQLVNGGNLLQVPKQKKKKKPVKSAAAASVDTPLVDPAVKEINLKAAATAKEPSPKANGKLNAVGKGGYVTCEVCDLTRFYSHISRRYGVFSCESCAKFFYRYSQKPVKYACATGTGRCPLNINLPGARCKSCLLEACFKKYILDPKKHPKIFANEAAIFSPFNVLIAGDGNGCVKGGPVGNNSAPKVNATEGGEGEGEGASPPSLLKQQLSQASTAKTVAATFPFSAEVLNPKKRKSCPATSNEQQSSAASHPPNSSSANNKQLCRR